MKYGLSLAFILAWWGAAYLFIDNSKGPYQPVWVDKESYVLPLFSPLDRDKIQAALEGNFGLMCELMIEWDQEALVVQREDLQMDRLSRKDFIKVLKLKKEISALNIKSPYIFLPQTYASASILLSLLPEDNISHLPQGYKLFCPYNLKKRDKIISEFSRYEADCLFLNPPAWVFLAPYSHPLLVQKLQSLNIPIYMTKELNSIEGIKKEIIALGKITQTEKKAQLLSLFMESTLKAIDNRLKLLNLNELPLYLSYASKFSLPTLNTLNGKLLLRLGLNQEKLKQETWGWKIEISREELLSQPQRKLIIGCEPRKEVIESLLKHPFLSHHKWYLSIVDERVQDLNDQYAILAYFDLYNALKNLCAPSS